MHQHLENYKDVLIFYLVLRINYFPQKEPKKICAFAVSMLKVTTGIVQLFYVCQFITHQPCTVYYPENPLQISRKKKSRFSTVFTVSCKKTGFSLLQMRGWNQHLAGGEVTIWERNQWVSVRFSYHQMFFDVIKRPDFKGCLLFSICKTKYHVTFKHQALLLETVWISQHIVTSGTYMARSCCQLIVRGGSSGEQQYCAARLL